MKKTYDFSKMRKAKHPVLGRRKAVGINLSTEVLAYFKREALETGIPYQKLIDMYLLDCVRSRRKLRMKWSA